MIPTQTEFLRVEKMLIKLYMGNLSAVQKLCLWWILYHNIKKLS